MRLRLIQVGLFSITILVSIYVIWVNHILPWYGTLLLALIDILYLGFIALQLVRRSRQLQMTGRTKRRFPKREVLQQRLEALFLGIYCLALLIGISFVLPRYFGHRQHHVAGFGYILAFFFAMPIVLVFWGMSRRQARIEFRRKNGMCLNCGYDLRGNSTGLCPECGEPFENISAIIDEKPAPKDQGHRIGPRSGR